jgi:hypothetical protein
MVRLGPRTPTHGTDAGGMCACARSYNRTAAGRQRWFVVRVVKVHTLCARDLRPGQRSITSAFRHASSEREGLKPDVAWGLVTCPGPLGV